MMEELIEPQEHCRGAWIPIEILRLTENGILSHTEAFLLSLINNLCSEEEGCFASNEYLAKRMNVCVRAIQKSLAKFKSLGLIRQAGFDGRRRILETAWSRIEINHEAELDDDDASEVHSRGEPEFTAEVNGGSPINKKPKTKKPAGKRRRVTARVEKEKDKPSLYDDAEVSKADKKRAHRLLLIFKHYDADMQSRTEGQIAKKMFQLRTERKVPEDKLDDWIRWLRDHYADRYTPRIRSLKDLLDWERNRAPWEADQAFDESLGPRKNPDDEAMHRRRKAIENLDEKQRALFEAIKAEISEDGMIWKYGNTKVIHAELKNKFGTTLPKIVLTSNGKVPR